MNRAVFLDRDGVVNCADVRDGKPYPPAGPEQVKIAPDVLGCLTALKQNGFLLIVVTNQPDVARGTAQREQIEAIHAKLRSLLPIDAFFVCYHDDRARCDCRKPRPGLLLEAASAYQVELAHSYIIGDRWRDVDAGNAAGCTTVWIDYRYRERSPAAVPDARVTSLAEATRWILSREATEGVLVSSPNNLSIKLFADGADESAILQLYANPLIQGFTTNPTLMRKAGVANFEEFARGILSRVPDRPVSFEVIADDFADMERQAHRIASWGENVYVKIPVTDTKGQSACDLICRLAQAGIKLNITALLTLAQVRDVAAALGGRAPSCISVFAGRIADTGRDPIPVMAAAVELIRPYGNIELIWASPRELLNIFQANAIGCHIITATPDILKKLSLVGRSLEEYSLETVRMFYNDALQSGYSF